jgi:hypothetical protein
MVRRKDETDSTAPPQVVAYHRCSAQGRKKDSIPTQRKQVRRWAKKHGLNIVREFADRGKSRQTVRKPRRSRR